MQISLVVAVSENGVIGDGGGIPWRLPDDQAFFKQLTGGHCIVMGRGTWESIGRLLPGRTTIIVTRNRAYAVPGAVVVGSLDEALEAARGRGEDEVFVVGGASLYAEALPLADRVHLTRVHARVEGEAHLRGHEAFRDEASPGQGPAARIAGWRLARSSHHPVDERHQHAFTIQCWERVPA